MKKNANAFFKGLKSESSTKERMNIYLDKKIQVRLKKLCADEKVRMSTVIEKLIENFLNEVEKK